MENGTNIRPQAFAPNGAPILDSTLPLADSSAPVIKTVYNSFGNHPGTVHEGDKNNATNPTLIGSAAANATVTIWDGDHVIGSVKADSVGRWQFTPTFFESLADGPHDLFVIVNGVSSEHFHFDVDTAAAPVVPTIDTVTGVDGISLIGVPTSNTHPNLSGSADPNTAVNILDGDKIIGTVYSDNSGHWSFTPDVALSGGTHTLTASTQTGVSAPVTLIETENVVAPVVPVVPSIDAVIDANGSSLIGVPTTNTHPTISGRADPNTTVTIFDGDKVVGTVQSNQSGNWSFHFDSALSSGNHELTASTQTGVSAPVTLIETESVVAPVVPVVPSIDMGYSETGLPLFGVPTTNTHPTISGRADPNTTVTIFDGDKVVGTVQSNQSGNWSFHFDTALSSGNHELTASTQTGVSAPVTLIEAETAVAPVVPVVPSIDMGYSETGLPLFGVPTTNTHPTISGRADPNTTVTIFDGDKIIGMVQSNQSGNWSFHFDTALSSGNHELTASTQAGVSAPVTLIEAENAVAPVVPVVPSIDAVIDNNGSSLIGVPTTEKNVQLSGTANANTFVNIFDGDTLVGKAYSDANGHWSWGLYLPDIGTHTLTVSTEIGGVSAPLSIIEVAPVVVPVVPTIDAAIDDNGSSLIGVPTTNKHPILSGTASADTDVTIRDGNTIIGTAHSDKSGHWTFNTTVALSAGTHNLTASTETGGVSAPVSIVEVAPVVTPVVPTIDAVIGGDGNSVIGVPTTENHFYLNGTAGPFEVVNIFENGVLMDTTYSDEKGHWSTNFYLDPSDIGTHTWIASTETGGTSAPVTIIEVAATPTPVVPTSDVVFHADGSSPTVVPTSEAHPQLHGTGGASTEGGGVNAPVTIQVDVPTSSVPTIDAAYGKVGGPQGVLHSGDVTDDGRPAMGGTAQAHSLVTIMDGDHVLGTARADEHGVWRFTPESPLSEGTHTLTVVNDHNTASSPFTVIVETPVSPVASNVDVLNVDVYAQQDHPQNGAHTDGTHPTLHDVLNGNEADLFAVAQPHDSAPLSVQDVAGPSSTDVPQGHGAMTSYDTLASHTNTLLPQEVVHHAM